MSSGIRYTEEFKREAVAQAVDRCNSVLGVTTRLGINTKSLYGWKKRYHKPERQIRQEAAKVDEIRRLKAELAQVTEERDILKRPRCISQKKPSKVRLHQSAVGPVLGARDVPHAAGTSWWLLCIAAFADEWPDHRCLTGLIKQE